MINTTKKAVSVYFIITVLFNLAACESISNEPKKIEFLNNKFAISIPASWSTLNDLNEMAEIQVGNLFKEAYTIILSENKMDFSDMTLQLHSDITRSLIQEGLENYQQSAPEQIKVNNYPAIRYQLSGTVDGTNVIYWHVTIETDDYYHQLLLWSLKSKFDGNKADFNSVINSFSKVEQSNK